VSDESMMQGFLDEAADHLETIEDDILTLEKQGEHPDADLVDRVFRAMHTIKGNAGFFGLDAIRDLAHVLEDLLSCVRNHEITMTRANADAVLEGVDQLNACLADPAASNSRDLSAVIGRVRGLMAKDLGVQKQHDLSAARPLQNEGGQAVNVDLSGFDLGKVRAGQIIYMMEIDLQEWEKKNSTSAVKLVKRLLDLGQILDVAIEHTPVDISKPIQTTNQAANLKCRVIVASSSQPDSIESVLGLSQQLIHKLDTVESESPTANEAMSGKSAPEKVAYLSGQLCMANLAPLVELMEVIHEAMQEQGQPKAWSTLANRLHTMAENILMAETPFNTGVHKLRQGLAKLYPEVKEQIIQFNAESVKGTTIPQNTTHKQEEALQPQGKKDVEKMVQNNKTPAMEPQKNTASNVEQEMPKAPTLPPEVKNALLAEFASQKLADLDDFEVMVLESEKGSQEALTALKGFLHTLKGEMGVLDLRKHGDLVHQIEHLLEVKQTGMEELLQYRDFLTVALSMSEDGNLMEPSDEIWNLFFAKDASAQEQAAQLEPEEKNSITENIDEQNTAPLQEQGEPASSLSKTQSLQPLQPSPQLESTQSAQSTQSASPTQNATHKADDSLRVSVQRLDKLIDTIGEAAIAHSIAAGDPVVRDLKKEVTSGERAQLRQKLDRLEIIMRQIQEYSMSLRMISLKGTFQKMSRLVRDLSRQLQKPVDFVVEGEDTELDKSIVEHLGDPLIHMIRNSMDHGIEDAATRKKSGKPETGTVTLRAYHKAGNVILEIRDDGKGLDLERILEKAIEKGLVEAGETISQAEIANLIFAPGFSTAKEVTQVSGRGVGMDVVKRNIEGMRGAVDITTEPGKGSVFTIRLPLTLAIISGMVIECQGEKYIVPTLSILETMRIQRKDVQSVTGKGEMIKLRNELLRVVHLSGMLQLEHDKQWQERIGLVVEDAMGRKCALLTDSIVDQQQVVIKKIGDGLGDIDGISGSAIMNDGKISLILDVNGITKNANNANNINT
jgi:two-component system, chemotaxis family, sensor kinase CheA